MGPAKGHEGKEVQGPEEGKAGVFVGVDAAVLQHLRVYHAGAQNLNPAFTFAQAASFAAALKAAHIHFGGRLGIREVVRTETHARSLAVQLFNKHFQRALQIAEGHVFVYHKAFNLWENRPLGAVTSSGTYPPPREADGVGGFGFFHRGNRPGPASPSIPCANRLWVGSRVGVSG